MQDYSCMPRVSGGGGWPRQLVQDGEFGSALAVVAVVQPRVQCVAGEIHLHDPTFQVVEVGLLGGEDLPCLLDRHRLGREVEDPHALALRPVVQRHQYDRLV